MSFLSPLGLLFGLTIPAVILLYLLKLKRIDTPISSTLLWRQSLEDLKANTPFQKLKQNLLMYLQLLILALLTMAAARPVLEWSGLGGRSIVLLIDHSASMNATDVRPSRLERAKQLALDVVNDMGFGDRMMVATFSSGAHVLTPFESNRGLLRTIIRSIEPTENPARAEEAFRIAQSAAEVQPNVEVILISDGGFSISDSLAAAPFNLRFAPVGVSGENVGIVDLMVRRDFTLDQNYQILAGVENFGSAPQEVYVELYGHSETIPEDGGQPVMRRALMDARRLNLSPGASEAILFSSPLARFPEIIEVVVDSDDPFPLDNQAWAVIEHEEDVRVLLVTAGNYFLERVLNVDARAHVTVIAPGQYESGSEYDVVIFDSFQPEEIDDGNYIFINTVPPRPDWSFGDTIEFPMILDYDRFHPLNRYIQFENLILNQCLNIGVPDWAEVILESNDTALIAAYRESDLRAVVIGFDIYDSNWPYRVSFPIFFANALDWLMTGEEESLMRRTGDVLTLPPPPIPEQRVELAPPGDAVPIALTFEGDSPIYFDQANRQGIYSYRLDGVTRSRYAVNLLSRQESNIAPVTALEFADGMVMGEEGGLFLNFEIWRWLAALALVVLFMEWWLYIKRARYSF